MTDGGKILSRHPNAAWRELDGQVVVVTPESGALHLFNGAGSFLWGQLESSRDEEFLAGVLLSEYDTDMETARKDVAEFAAEMAEKKIIIRE